MSVKTVRNTVIAALVLVAAVTLMQTAKDETSKRKVVVTGLWLESPRDDRVEVTIAIGPSLKATAHIMAPVTRVYKVSPGTRVQIRLRLLGSSGARFLGCLLTVDGLPPLGGAGRGDVSLNQAAPGAEVTCWAVA